MQILQLLTKDEELTVTALQTKLSIDQSLLSHHLINMRNKGVLDARRQGKNIFYYLADSAYVKAINTLLGSQIIPA